MVDIAQNLFSTRRGSVIVGVGAAVIAAIVVFVYLHNYRNSLKSSAAPATVLVAKNLIQKGTPGNIIGSSNQFQVASLPKSQLQIGAITDPAALNGRVAAIDIYPGQQLTATDFVYSAPDALTNQITGDERAISLPIEPAPGLNNQLAAGDHIDVFVGYNYKNQPIFRLFIKDLPILRPPIGGIATVKASLRQSAMLAWAAGNAKMWWVLRPPNGARTPWPGILDTNSLLSLRPVNAVGPVK